jgi:hypothetical protein
MYNYSRDQCVVFVCRRIATREQLRSAINRPGKTQAFNASMREIDVAKVQLRRRAMQAQTAGELHAAEVDIWDIQRAVQASKTPSLKTASIRCVCFKHARSDNRHGSRDRAVDSIDVTPTPRPSWSQPANTNNIARLVR